MVGRSMLRAFDFPVVLCCVVLLKIELMRMLRRTIVARTCPNEYNIMQHLWMLKNLTIFKFESTTPTMSQHVATWWPNACNKLRPTLLRYVALNYCDRNVVLKYCDSLGLHNCRVSPSV